MLAEKCEEGFVPSFCWPMQPCARHKCALATLSIFEFIFFAVPLGSGRASRAVGSLSASDVGPVNRAGAVPAARPLRWRSGMKTVLVIDDDEEFRLPLSVF